MFFITLLVSREVDYSKAPHIQNNLHITLFIQYQQENRIKMNAQQQIDRHKHQE